MVARLQPVALWIVFQDCPAAIMPAIPALRSVSSARPLYLPLALAWPCLAPSAGATPFRDWAAMKDQDDTGPKRERGSAEALREYEALKVMQEYANSLREQSGFRPISAFRASLLWRPQARRIEPIVEMRRGIRPTCFREQLVPFGAGREFRGFLAHFFRERDEPIF